MDGFHKVDVGLNLGHATLREHISAETQRSAAIKEAAKAAAKLDGASVGPEALPHSGRDSTDHKAPVWPNPPPSMGRVYSRPHRPVSCTVLTRSARGRPMVCPGQEGWAAA